MDIRHIKYFIELSKHEHVSETATLLNISQPALSKIISQLEAEIRVKLFNRSGNRIYLNKNGQIYLNYVEKAMDLLNTGTLAAQNIDNSLMGTIRIACHAYPAIATDNMTEYSKINPYVDFVILTPQEFDYDIRFFSVDANSTLPPDSNHVRRKIFNEDYYIAASSLNHNIDPNTDSLELSALKNERFVGWFSENLFIKDVTHTLCQNAGFFPKIYCKASGCLEKMKIVSNSNALCIIPGCCIQDFYMMGSNIKCYSISDVSSPRSVYISRNKLENLSDVARDFWDFILERYGLEEDPETVLPLD